MISFVNIVDRISLASYAHRQLLPVNLLPEGSLIGHKKPAGRKVFRYLHRFLAVEDQHRRVPVVCYEKVCKICCPRKNLDGTSNC